ncbi:MAG: hypothetical protein IKF82_08085 [Bacilli bacterium]|nr:hypothetical protein [Bacilli bacterium]
MKIGKYVFIGFYLLFVLIITVLLFTFNRFSNSVVFGKTVAGIKDDLGKFNMFDLLIISRKSEIKVGDNILFYDTSEGKNFLNTALVKKIMTNDSGVLTYVIRDNEFLADDYVLSKTDDVKNVAIIGLFYLIFTSKIGYLLFVIIPIVLYFAFYLRKYKKL